MQIRPVVLMRINAALICSDMRIKKEKLAPWAIIKKKKDTEYLVKAPSSSFRSTERILRKRATSLRETLIAINHRGREKKKKRGDEIRASGVEPRLEVIRDAGEKSLKALSRYSSYSPILDR